MQLCTVWPCVGGVVPDCYRIFLSNANAVWHVSHLQIVYLVRERVACINSLVETGKTIFQTVANDVKTEE